MTFQISPHVQVRERAISSIIPAVATANAGTVGAFTWGPAEEIVLITPNEDVLVDRFGKPNNTNFRDWMTTSSFLAYARSVNIVRVIPEDALNATADDTTSTAGTLVKNLEHYESQVFDAGLHLWIAKYPGELGNSIGVAWADNDTFIAEDSNGPTWKWHNLFNTEPGTNELHVVVYDAGGKITGTVDEVLEIYPYLSTQEDAVKPDGTSAYFVEALKRSSPWVWVGNDGLISSGSDGVQLGAGDNGENLPEDADYQAGWALFQNTEEVEVNILFVGGVSPTTAVWVKDNVAEYRKDCVVCVSPSADDVVGIFDKSQIISNIRTTRSLFGSSSYTIMDSAYKYMYDRYNKKWRWVPCNGDMAGLLAKTDTEFDAWFSPGLGSILNCQKFSWKQMLADRNEIYKVGVNPLVVFPTDGPVLFGDKTLHSRPDAFDRINVRRLFLVLEKAIATAARYKLFKFNDVFTRTNYINKVEPFLRTVQGRRGIARKANGEDGFRVVCDETNNTPDVINRNEFVAAHFIIPNKSINAIRLNFLAVDSGVEFTEEILEQGQF